MSEFLAGCASGAVQSIIGHPLDTMKVLIQSKRRFHSNPLHYYRGVSFPTVMNILTTGIVFDLNARIYKETNSYYKSGFLTGGITAPILYLFDVGKIHYQTSPTKTIEISQFMRGGGRMATLARESLATSIYMGVYFNMENKLGAFKAGGLAGLASWTFTYPIDVIKTRQMNDVSLSWKRAIKMGNLWRGYMICALRAVLVNSSGFWAYSYFS